MDTLKTILDLFIGAGAAQGFFLAIILLGRRKRNGGEADAILALLMSLFSANIVHAIFIRGFSAYRIAGDRLVYEPLQLLFGPCLYFYVRALTENGRRIGTRDLVHFVPFALLLLPFIPGHFTALNASLARVFNLALWGGIILQMSLYVGATIHQTARHDAALRDLKATTVGDLAWIKGFLAAFLALSGAYFILLALMIHGHSMVLFYKIQALTLSATVFGLGYRIVAKPPAQVEATAVDAEPTARKYGKSGLSREESDQIAAELGAFMDRARPYLDPALDLASLAEAVGIARNQVSQAINESIGRNFYDFVNAYRVEECKRRMADPAFRAYKLLAIALDSGFASKPAFNASFRRSTGMTPSQYRDGQSRLE